MSSGLANLTRGAGTPPGISSATAGPAGPVDAATVTERLTAFWGDATRIWLDGGWAMIAIAGIALVMFGVGLGTWLRLRATGFRSVPEHVWRRWIQYPGERRGPVGEMLDFVTGGRSLEATLAYFRQLRVGRTAPFERDLKVMRVCVSAAPLVGLLGTVTGMLATFNAMAAGGGGDKTMAMIAKGISEALVTTETGLVVALPGVFFQYRLSRAFSDYKVFLAHLETVCVQTLYRGAELERRRRVDVAARAEAAAILRRRLRERLSSGFATPAADDRPRHGDAASKDHEPGVMHGTLQ